VKHALALVLLVVAAPAYAGGAAQVSEPSQLALVALGILGVIVGRNAAKRRKSDDD
jgi:hypothetical protein